MKPKSISKITAKKVNFTVFQMALRNYSFPSSLV